MCGGKNANEHEGGARFNVDYHVKYLQEVSQRFYYETVYISIKLQNRSSEDEDAKAPACR